MSDYYDANKSPELLPEHLADPEKRAQFEASKRSDMARQLNEMARNLSSNPDEYRVREGDDTVWIKNNRARALTLGNVSVPGELDNIDDTSGGDGPFALVKQAELDSNMKLTLLFEDSEDRKAPLTRLTKEEYKEEYRKYLQRHKERKERIGNREVTEAEKERRDEFKVRPGVLLNQPQDQS